MMWRRAHIPGKRRKRGWNRAETVQGGRRPEKCGDSLSIQKKPNCGHRRKKQ